MVKGSLKHLMFLTCSILMIGSLSWGMDISGESVTLNHSQVITGGFGDLDAAVKVIFRRQPTEKEIDLVKYWLEWVHSFENIQYDAEKQLFTSKVEETEETEEMQETEETKSLDVMIEEINKTINSGGSVFNREGEKITQPINLAFDYVGDREKGTGALPLHDVAEHLKDRIAKIVETEKGNVNKTPIYHAAATWNAFVIEIITRVMTKCKDSCDAKVFRFSKSLSEVNDIEEFRGKVFKNLSALNPAPANCDSDCQSKRDIIKEELQKQKVENDQESNDFKATILSASPTLFGGYLVPNESSIGFWINGFAPYQDRFDIYQKDFDRVLKTYFKDKRIADNLGQIANRAIELYQELFPLPTSGNETPNSGVLYQFLVDPKVLDKMTYISAPFGFLVAKSVGGDLTENPSQILKDLKVNTNQFIQANRQAHYMDPVKDRKLCDEGVDLACTQIRMLPKINWLTDQDLVTIKTYFVKEPTKEWKLKFYQAAEEIANQIVKAGVATHDFISSPSTNWWERVAFSIFPYLTAPYLDKVGGNLEIEREVESKKYRIFRPNHGFAHGLRQGFLASDIIDGLEKLPEGSFKDTSIENMRKWVAEKVKTDTNFQKKVELLASYQRTGRNSEAGEGPADKEYRLKYARQDRDNFVRDAKTYFMDIFNSEQEIEDYGKTLAPSDDVGTLSDELQKLKNIILASHLLDLRRLGYNESKYLPLLKALDIKFLSKEIDRDKSGVGYEINSNEAKFIHALWHRSGQYLHVTGETDMDDSSKSSYRPEFFKLAMDPRGLINVLEDIHQTPMDLDAPPLPARIPTF